MKLHAPDRQYTIRGVPDEVDRALRRRARHRGISLNQLIVDELIEAVGERRRKADFSDLVGRWKPDPAFDEIVDSQRPIDLDMWK